MGLRLNCDLGESFGAWRMGMDEAVMPHIDQANIACGFHAGDPQVMEQTLLLAQQYGVEVGAHPGYPDLMGFGRRSMTLNADEIRTLVHYQVAALDGMAASIGVSVSYVKPHGALYNDMMRQPAIRQAIMAAVASFHRPLTLMLQATQDAPRHRQEAAEHGIGVYLEAFADRGYDGQGRLLPRARPDALLDHAAMLAQVRQLVTRGSVHCADTGQELPLPADTLCVHGDNPAAIAAVQEIRQIIQANG